MQQRTLSFLIVVAAAAAPVLGLAAEAAPDCQLPSQEIDPLGQREALLAEYERMPQQCLKAIVHECTAAAGRSLLDPASVAVCSFGYEALLRKGFGGNFQALMAWWRSERPASETQ